MRNFIYLINNRLLDFIIFFNVIPIFFLIGLPFSKLIFLLVSFIILVFFNLNKVIYEFRIDKLNFFILIFFIYHILNLLLAYFQYQPNYFNKEDLFYETILSYSLHGSLPLIVIAVIRKLDLKNIVHSRLFINLVYSIFALTLIISIFKVSQQYNISFQLSSIRDIFFMQSKLSTFEFSKNSLPSLYKYYGRSNTLGPALTLVFLNMLPYIRRSISGKFSIKNFLLALIGVIDFIVIFLLYSRASIIAITLGFLMLEIFNILKFRQYFFRFTLKFLILLISSNLLIIFLTSSGRYSITAFFEGGRYEILKGLLNYTESIKWFGNGIGSNYYLCSYLGKNYSSYYGTDFCTLHNYYATLLHDYGIFGTLIFFIIFYIFLSRLLLSIRLFINEKKNNELKISEYPIAILTSFYFITGSSLLLFFDSDIMTQHTIFSVLYWSLFGLNYYDLNFYINKIKRNIECSN